MRIIVVILCLMLICLSSESSEASPQPSITGYSLLNSVTLDGKWTSTEEWADTSDVALAPWSGSGTAYLRIKHDNSNLYVLLDFVSDRALSWEDKPLKHGDSAMISFGQDQIATYSFQTTWIASDQFRFAAWNGSKALETDLNSSGSTSQDSSQDPYNQDPHLIYEFKVPKHLMTNPTSFTASLFDNDDEVFMFWPARNNTSTEEQWGNLTLVDAPIPEFPTKVLSIILLATIAVAAVLLAIAHRYAQKRSIHGQRAKLQLSRSPKIAFGA